MANITITYRLFNSNADSTMSFHGTDKGAEEYARRLVKSGGWLSASINGRMIEATSKKRNHAHVVPALTQLSYKAKELEKVAFTRELSPDEVVQLTVLFQEVVSQVAGLPAPAPARPTPVAAPAPKVEAPSTPSFDALPSKPAIKVEEKQPEPAKKGLFTR